VPVHIPAVVDRAVHAVDGDVCASKGCSGGFRSTGVIGGIGWRAPRGGRRTTQSGCGAWGCQDPGRTLPA
jgi:hypothetical protein